MESAEKTPEVSDELNQARKELINVLVSLLNKGNSAHIQKGFDGNSLIQARRVLVEQLSAIAQESMSKSVDLPENFAETQPLSREESLLIAEFTTILEERFGSKQKLASAKHQSVWSLFRGNKVAFNAPSGSMKSVILYLLAQKEHQASGKQTILTAESHLQENELVLADRLGLKGGVVAGSMAEFLAVISLWLVFIATG